MAIDDEQENDGGDVGVTPPAIGDVCAQATTGDDLAKIADGSTKGIVDV
jgi:hypothetical protein